MTEINERVLEFMLDYIKDLRDQIERMENPKEKFTARSPTFIGPPGIKPITYIKEDPKIRRDKIGRFKK